jgi:hypothetical protein
MTVRERLQAGFIGGMGFVLYPLIVLSPKRTEAVGLVILLISALTFVNLENVGKGQITYGEFVLINEKLDNIWELVGAENPNEKRARQWDDFWQFDDRANGVKPEQRWGLDWLSPLSKIFACIGTMFIVIGKWRDGIK